MSEKEYKPGQFTPETAPEGNRFVKGGPSPNPGGRPRGLERLVREIVGDDIVAMTKAQVSIAKGIKPAGCENLPPIKAADMTKAYDAVVDRGWGKARQVVDLSGGASGEDVDLTKMTDEELEAFIRQHEQLAAEESSDAQPAPGSSEG